MKHLNHFHTCLLIFVLAGICAEATAQDLPAMSRRAGKAVAKVTIAHDWQPLGNATYIDDVLPVLFQGFGAATYSVAMETDRANPGYYRLANPYGEAHPSYSFFHTIGYTLKGDHYIVIDATDPENVIIEPSMIGLTISYGDLMLYSYSWLAANDDPEITEEYVDRYNLRGTMHDGVISFATPGALWLTTPELDENTSGYNTNMSGKFKIMLPGVKDYSIEVATEGWCTDSEHNLIVSAWTGADVASARLAVVTDPDDKTAVDKALAAAPAVNPREGTVISMPAGTAPAAKLYIAGASYDSSGREQQRAFNHCYTPDTADGWESMPGKAAFTDDIVSNLFSDITLGTRDVDVERNSANPQLYRLVNPYFGISYNMIDAYHGAHSHYIYLDATDPDCVIMRESPIGMGTIDDGHIAITSQAWRIAEAGETTAAIKAAGAGGVMRDGIITFPSPTELVVAFHTEAASHWYYVNCERDGNGNVRPGRLAIDLNPAGAGIADITADTAAPEYYNLQGIRIDSPEPGRICIERRGSSAAKVRF